MNQVKLFLNKYKILKIWFKQNLNENNNNNEQIKLKIDKSVKFLKFIDFILAAMDKELAEILIAYYVDQKPKEELNYSNSTFYSKLKKASETFMEYWDMYDISGQYKQI